MVRSPDRSVFRLLLASLVAAQASACTVDDSGLGENIAFEVDATVPDTLAADSGTPVVEVDSASGDAVDAATLDVADTVTFDAADSADTLDAADTFAADTREVGPDTLVPVDTGQDAFDAATDAVSCTEPMSVLYLGHCYFLLAMPRTQADAELACKAAGAALASITSAGEQAIVAGLGSDNRWIGLVKDDGAPMARTSFRWTTGESAQVYDGWEATEPNGGESCARMKPTNLWGDVACTTPYPAICERK